MVDRRYSLNLKPWSARTLYVYVHADLAQKYSVGLQEIFVSRLCSQEENSFFLPWQSALNSKERRYMHLDLPFTDLLLTTNQGSNFIAAIAVEGEQNAVDHCGNDGDFLLYSAIFTLFTVHNTTSILEFRC